MNRFRFVSAGMPPFRAGLGVGERVNSGAAVFVLLLSSDGVLVYYESPLIDMNLEA